MLSNSAVRKVILNHRACHFNCFGVGAFGTATLLTNGDAFSSCYLQASQSVYLTAFTAEPDWQWMEDYHKKSKNLKILKKLLDKSPYLGYI
jgi:hypothetical protein